MLSHWAAEVTGRPVKWIAERSEAMLSDEQARDSVIDAELALDKDGNILALRTLSKTAMGAYNTSDRNVMPTLVAIGCLTNTYKTPAIHGAVRRCMASIAFKVANNEAFQLVGAEPAA